MREGWTYKKFEDCLVKAPKAKQVQTSQYNTGTKYPIVSQEDKLVSGFFDDDAYLFRIDSPIVVFGDHTRVLKYIDFDFVVGADGVKILIPKEFLNAKLLYYYLLWYKIPNLGYSRHYKLLKELDIPLPPLSEQQSIVAELDKINELISLKKAQLSDLDNLAQSIFYDMFGDPIVNEKGWEVKMLKEIGRIITGNTPSKAVPEYYDDNFIEWIKTDNIEKNQLYATEAKEYLSEKGANCGRVVNKGSLLVACIAGSLDSIGKACVTDRRVAFNQQINAIVPYEIMDILFLYHLITRMKGIIQERASTGMKHILTKSVMEEIVVPLPPLSIQQKFAKRIELIEQQKAQINSTIKDLETLLASRMQYWFD